MLNSVQNYIYMKVQKSYKWISQQFICTFLGEEELSQISQPLQVSGGGGQYATDKIPYQLSLAKDHPKGEEPTTIKDDSENLRGLISKTGQITA